MNVPEILGNAAGPTGLLGFIIIIGVAFAHGGKYRMSPLDPALKIEISPIGKKFLLLAGCLIIFAVVLAITSILLG